MMNPETSCIFCNADNSTFLYNTTDIFQNQFRIRQCEDCKAYFLSPFPTTEMLEKAYDVSYYGNQETKFKDGPVEKVIDSFRKRRAKRLTKQLPLKARVLDVGCGNGNFLHYLSAYGDYELHGIERDGMAASRAIAKPGLIIKTTPLSTDNYPSDYFDAITLFHVFEHLTNPAETLTIIKNILKPGGILCLSFPNINSMQSRLFKGKWLHLDPPRHLFFFAPDDFKKLMKQRGFDCIKENYFSIEQNPFGIVQSILNSIFNRREILFERLKGNNEYAPECGQICIFMQKLFFMLSFPLFVIMDAIVSVFRKGATFTFQFKLDKR